ncbi:LysM peptidoglycan-binding domain-containing protein [Paenibacillus sp. V4I5]|uniref:LysM peptidoglycan-binding domain-containing protein n=1 Tax=Paenibacillus sp. V4I5 TaxID=3042306 RepID=UPI00278FC3EC|nr:LysM peptidoglycan-binding domain-containing protein [Paenibacillus sp. V4I5]MDQ0919176.1 murein DD-endopeptidase MepM/ murein hydrolase activator NlpD [Paenibacillus sp. V4I5]
MKKTTMFSLALTFSLLTGNMASAMSYSTYTIQRGDTLWSVSQRLNISLASVLAANPQVNPNNVYEGLKINMPVGEKAKAADQTNTTNNTYTVQLGDNFWVISKSLNIDWSRLVAANPNVNAANMYVGMKINLPVAGTVNAINITNTPNTNTATNVTYATNSDNTIANNRNGTSSTNNIYTVQPGDNFWLISQKLNIEWSRLVAANPNVNAANMYVGMKINLPTNLNVQTNTNSDNHTSTSSSMPASSVEAPSYLSDGLFPLKPGTYSSFINTFGDGRTFNADGTQQRNHEGNDIMAVKGTPIYSVYSGTVIKKGWNTLGGWRLTVKIPDGKTAFYYAHMSAYATGVEIGSSITKGQLIGYVGNTGYGEEGTEGAFDPHLHFGMYDITNGFIVEDPYNYLKYWEKTSLTAKY